MMRSGVRWSLLASVLAVTAAVTWMLLHLLLRGGGSLPRVSWLGVGVIGLLAVVLAAAGWDVRRYLLGKHRRRPSTNRARYTLVGSQAGALTGALLSGWYLASALAAQSLPDVPTTRETALRYWVHLGAAVLLTLAGMLGQWCCRLPSPHDDEDEPRAPSGPEPAAGLSRDARR